MSVVFTATSASSLANGRFPAAGQLIVDPADSTHIVVRATFGLLQSFDTGATWMWICEEAVRAMGFQDPEIIVTTGGRVVMGLPDGLAVGERGGCDWSRVPGLANDDVIDVVENGADPAQAYAAAVVTVDGAYNGLIARTADGVSWSMVGGLIPDTYPLTIEVAPSNPDRLYLGTNDGNLEAGFIDVSDDGGGSWRVHDSPAGVDSAYVSAVDPQDPDRVYVRSYFPQNNLYVSEDGAATWMLVHASNLPLTAFALSTDGRHIAIGGADGLTIMARADGAAGSGYTVTMTNALAVTCLSWTASGLFACADEATAGFTIGMSKDGGGTFTPLLRLAELTPLSCPAGTSASSCSSAWCSTASVIGAPCVVTVDAASDTALDGAHDGSGAGGIPAAGCSCAAAGAAKSPWCSVIASMMLLLGARRSLRKRCARIRCRAP